MGSTASSARQRQLLAEHEAIRSAMREVHAELDRLLAHPARPGDDWRLPELLRSFRKHLRQHFVLEESGGLLDEALPGDPGTLRVVDQLVAQHREFERVADRVLTGLDSGIVPPTVVQQCYDRDLRRLLADLERHESLENDLLQRLVTQETGRGD